MAVEAFVTLLRVEFIAGRASQHGRDVCRILRRECNRNKPGITGRGVVKVLGNHGPLPLYPQTCAALPLSPETLPVVLRTGHENVVRLLQLVFTPARPALGRRRFILVECAIDTICPEAV